MNRVDALVKRAVDVTASGVALAVLAPLLIAIGCLIRLTSPGPALFRQQRMGRGFRPFWIYKFRTMTMGADRGGLITWGGDQDPRVTTVGRWLRRSKLDELPQLLNVLRGEMSLVGPRPEVEKYVAMFRDDYREILQAKPGITDYASLKFRDEASLLAGAKVAEDMYVGTILPEKIRLSRQYVRSSSLFVDLWLLVRTLLSVFRTTERA